MWPSLALFLVFPLLHFTITCDFFWCIQYIVGDFLCKIRLFAGGTFYHLFTVTATFIIAVPAPEVSRVAPSNTSVEVTVSKPSGLCEGLRSSQITYEFKVYRSNS